MKILIFANGSSGLFGFRGELLQAVLDAGHEVYVCVPDGEYVPRLIDMGCIFEPCEFNRHSVNPISDLRILACYKRVLQKISPDIVFTYTIKPNIYGGIACAQLHIPYVVNITGLGVAIENGGLLQKISLFLYRIGLRKAKEVFFQNEGNLAFMEERHIIRGKYDLLPGSGVNLQKYCFEPYPADDGTEVFLYMGRLMRDKGIGELVRAAERICTKYNNVRFVAIGSCEEDYQAELKKLDAGHFVSFEGAQKDVRKWIKSATAIVHPSYHEGMSNALLEAAACGRPVIATDVPGCREIFDEGVSGLGLRPRDVDSLCEALEKFIALPYEKKVEMGRAGREKMEREFDRQIVVDKYMGLVKQIEEEKSHGTL